MILSGPNLVINSTSATQPAITASPGSFGPFGYNGRVFEVLWQAGIFGSSSTFVASQEGYDGPPNWTVETSGYPTGFEFNNRAASCFFDGQRIWSCGTELSTGNSFIFAFDCATRTYSQFSATGLVSPFSTLVPWIVQSMPDGSVLMLGAKTTTGLGFYRCTSGAWSPFISVRVDASHTNQTYALAVNNDGVGNTVHLYYKSDSTFYYRKVFADNSMTLESVQSGVSGGVGYDIFAQGAQSIIVGGRMFIAVVSSRTAVNALVSVPLDDTTTNESFTFMTPVVTVPPSPDPAGFDQIVDVAMVVSSGSAWLIVSALQLDTGGNTLGDSIYASQYASGVWTAQTNVADFVANPPIVPPPFTSVPPGSQFEHFSGGNGLPNGNVGFGANFWTYFDGAELDCLHFYTEIQLSGAPPPPPTPVMIFPPRRPKFGIYIHPTI